MRISKASVIKKITNYLITQSDHFHSGTGLSDGKVDNHFQILFPECKKSLFMNKNKSVIKRVDVTQIIRSYVNDNNLPFVVRPTIRLYLSCQTRC